PVAPSIRLASCSGGCLGGVRRIHVDDLSVDAARKRPTVACRAIRIRRWIRRALFDADHLSGRIDAECSNGSRRDCRRRQRRVLLRGAHVATSFRCACTLISTPRPMKSEIIAVPPYDTSGSGTPTTGKSPLTMLMLTTA